MTFMIESTDYYGDRRWIKNRWQIRASVWLRARGDTVDRLSGDCTYVAVDHGRDVILTWMVGREPIRSMTSASR